MNFFRKLFRDELLVLWRHLCTNANKQLVHSEKCNELRATFFFHFASTSAKHLFLKGSNEGARLATNLFIPLRLLKRLLCLCRFAYCAETGPTSASLVAWMPRSSGGLLTSRYRKFAPFVLRLASRAQHFVSLADLHASISARTRSLYEPADGGPRVDRTANIWKNGETAVLQ